MVQADIVSGLKTPWAKIADDLDNVLLEMDLLDDPHEFEKRASDGSLHRFNKIER